MTESERDQLDSSSGARKDEKPAKAVEKGADSSTYPVAYFVSGQPAGVVPPPLAEDERLPPSATWKPIEGRPPPPHSPGILGLTPLAQWSVLGVLATLASVVIVVGIARRCDKAETSVSATQPAPPIQVSGSAPESPTVTPASAVAPIQPAPSGESPSPKPVLHPSSMPYSSPAPSSGADLPFR